MKILIIRAGALGDTLMLMPSVAQLRKSVEILFAGRSPGIDYLAPYLYRCIDYERSGWHMLFMKETCPVSNFSLPDIDHVVAFLGDPEGIVRKNLKHIFPKAMVHMFPVFPPEGKKIHMSLYMALVLQDIGLPINPEEAVNYAKEHPLLSAGCVIKKQGSIVFHPGSGSLNKNYPPEFWLELIGTIHEENPGIKQKMTLLLGPAEEGVLSFYMDKVNNNYMEILFCPEKKRLLSILGNARLYIGHDSGITHLAAMMGAPVIALFRNSDPAQWRPLGPGVKVIKEEKGGSGLIKHIISGNKNF